MRRTLICAVAALATLWPMAVPTPATAAAACSRGRAEGTRPTTQTPWERQWLDLDHAWTMAGAPTTVRVAVIDTGVDVRHPQLARAVLPGTDLVDGGDGRVDCTGHGTALASLVGARTEAKVPFAGVAPQARILPVRVAERIDDDMDPRLVADGLDWAVARGARIAVMAYTLPTDSPAVRAAVARAVARDVLVIASAGTVAGGAETRGAPVPATYPGVLGVSAVDGTGTVQPETYPGPHVDLAAPGVGITAAAPARGHTNYSGPDMAAAVTAGVAALVWADDPQAAAGAVTRRLAATADPSPGGAGSPSYGAGIVNPVRALSEPVATGEPRLPNAFLPVPAAAGGAGPARGAVIGAICVVAALGVTGLGALRRARRRSRQ
ncbi:S8 family serine peptidase [Micromonospora sp. NPDC049048]|uniref:S8 family serine peptidase n=1 Tax=Micromonospora sp. NPDC049048 TaxID=3364263 RepID=UPI00372025B9